MNAEAIREAILGYYQEQGLDPHVGLGLADEIDGPPEVLALVLELALQWAKARTVHQPASVHFHFWPVPRRGTAPFTCQIMLEYQQTLVNWVISGGNLYRLNNVLQAGLGTRMVVTNELATLVDNGREFDQSCMSIPHAKCLPLKVVRHILPASEAESWNRLAQIRAMVASADQAQIV